MKVLTFTYNNGFMVQEVKRNNRNYNFADGKTTGKKTIFFITPFMRTGYKKWYMGQGNVSNLHVFHRVMMLLYKRGWNVHLLVNGIDDPDFFHTDERIIDGVIVHFCKLPFKSFFKFIQRYFPKAFKLALYFDLIFSVVRVLRMGLKYKPDIYYAVCQYSLCAYLSARLIGGHNITRMFGTFLSKYLDNPKIFKYHISEYLGYKVSSDYLIITDDGSQGDKVADILNVSRERLRFWKNGIDHELYISDFNKYEFRKKNSLPDDKIILISVNRLDGWKRVDRTLESLAIVKKHVDNFIFLIIGDGPEKNTLLNMVNKLALDRHVSLLGHMPHEQVKFYLNAADIFIANYDLSNLGTSLYEAMICGKAIITIDTGDTGAIVKNEINGLLIRRQDNYVQDIANALLRLIKKLEYIDILGKRARQYVIDNFYSLDFRVEMEIALLEKVASIENE